MVRAARAAVAALALWAAAVMVFVLAPARLRPARDDDDDAGAPPAPASAAPHHAAPASAAGAPDAPAPAARAVHAFYYGWYATPATDGEWSHWNHRRLPHWDAATARKFSTARWEPPGEAGSPFYPELGLYSTQDPVVVRDQMKQMAAAGIGVAVASWWGPKHIPGSADGEGWITDAGIGLQLDMAAAAGIRLGFHLEPREGRTIAEVRRDLEYIFATYGAHRAFAPVFYCYDAYQLPYAEWGSLLASLRGTPLDGEYYALVLEVKDRAHHPAAGFDGVYTYFAASGFTHACTPSNWGGWVAWARSAGLRISLSVGPGYDDRRVRPWNGQATRDRRHGAYFVEQLKAAVAAQPDVISVTSWNEWGEGTSIEPAIPRVGYADYGGVSYTQLLRDGVRGWSPR